MIKIKMNGVQVWYSTAVIADKFGVAEPTVTQWCRRGLFSNAYKPSPRSTWMIPDSDLLKFQRPKMGQPKKIAR